MAHDGVATVGEEAWVTLERRVLTVTELADVARAAVGAAHRLVDVTRLEGGTKKGVYRLVFDDGFTAVAYVWDDNENYWPSVGSDGAQDLSDPFSNASALDLFEASRRHLEALAIRSPEIILTDRTATHFPGDVAVVEDVTGGTLEALIRSDLDGAANVMGKLGETLARMRGHKGQHFGKVALIDEGGVSAGATCEQVVMDRAIGDLANAASRDTRVARQRGQLEELAHELVGFVAPRAQYGLIHGELGPDHVLLDSQADPVLIDIEGLMFFDIEWEHAFLRLRFGEQYRWLECSGLDDNRMTFYTFAMHLSLVAGPLRLLDGDYPHRHFLEQIAEHHLHQLLGFLP